ncbi:nickel pincer cofactor biosynthesis protein LarC [Desulfogranum mediterraneum]|uniref:nickel pincer cofactor biosynthesis protein LarC n=1 Tax=Desulfogranum mediterraneum TaxID=160661 RepID=UPI00048A4BCF|nr:nickel pincer cofactor biosynthesis protein LarC [Desulfogranum mediterraneum]
MKQIYLDCFSGVSGNMLLGALLDGGVPEAYLRQTIESVLGKDEFELVIRQKQLNGFACCQVEVNCREGHHHRHLGDIAAILERSALQAEVADGALRVFQRLARAEAAVHGTSVEKIHFHEVGAVDAIVDIVGTVAGFFFLGPATISCSHLPINRGWVRCAHGEIPLPAPAVCRLLEGVPVYGDTVERELVTPTGAALVVELSSSFGLLPPMTLQHTSYGAGTLERPDGRPNLLRLLQGEELRVAEAQEVEVVDTHIDDWNPELWPHVSTLLMEAGALDVSLSPIQMKKGRPGFLVRAICTPALTPAIKTILFAETTTLGLRIRREQRATLPREGVKVETPWGPVAAKKILRPKGVMITPEYEACRQLAQAKGVSLQAVYAAVAEWCPEPSKE